MSRHRFSNPRSFECEVGVFLPLLCVCVFRCMLRWGQLSQESDGGWKLGHRAKLLVKLPLHSLQLVTFFITALPAEPVISRGTRPPLSSFYVQTTVKYGFKHVVYVYSRDHKIQLWSVYIGYLNRSTSNWVRNAHRVRVRTWKVLEVLEIHTECL
jgi:hypothetical protein